MLFSSQNEFMQVNLFDEHFKLGRWRSKCTESILSDLSKYYQEIDKLSSFHKFPNHATEEDGEEHYVKYDNRADPFGEYHEEFNLLIQHCLQVI